jgi:endonuclease III
MYTHEMPLATRGSDLLLNGLPKLLAASELRRYPVCMNPLQLRVRKILKILGQLYPDAHCALDYRNPLELLVATILSAQCTDARVNMVTPDLFQRYPDAAAFAAADQEQLEQAIRSTGFFRNKARNIKACCRTLVENHQGQVPDKLEELIPLAGIGRKTANVILGNAFAVPGITVDTHVGRVSRRLGMTKEQDPVKVEFALMKLVPKKEWTMVSHRLIFHGRQVCFARKPACSTCTLAGLCPKIGVTTTL